MSARTGLCGGCQVTGIPTAIDSLRESLDGLQGTVSPDGRFTAANDHSASAGLIKATVEGVTGVART